MNSDERKLWRTEDGRQNEVEIESAKPAAVHEETGSLLSQDDIEKLASYDDGVSGYFGKMLDWLENFIEAGVKAGRFTEEQARRDLQIALWYAFACNNMDEYVYYYKAKEWMKDSEVNAAGCATWYYRYSCALLYCGLVNEALRYAEKGAQEEPEYPWVWLQVAKLRAHFGDKTGALDAVERGLALVPGDHEFTTLRREIEEGRSLEEMLWHWIDPDSDEQLQEGGDPSAAEKQHSIDCITADPAGLEAFNEIFQTEKHEYSKDSPFCVVKLPLDERLVEVCFRMNEAAASKLGVDWLRWLKNRIDSGDWTNFDPEDDEPGVLELIFVTQMKTLSLVYKQPNKERWFQIFRTPEGELCSEARFLGIEASRAVKCG